MKKLITIILITITFFALIFVVKYFIDANSESIIDYKTETPFYTSINTKVVATGKLNPEDEIELKPQVTGIVDIIYVEEGDMIQKGDLIAKIRVVPNEQSLTSAKSRINSSKLSYENSKRLFERSKELFNKGVISKQDYENSELSLNQANESYLEAQNVFKIIKQGSLSGGGSANTNIIAQISGTILEIPVREGNQVIESNNFNAGTTIATVADMSIMIFEGQVDEAEVGKLEEGSEIMVVLGALGEEEFPSKLTFVAPKGVEVNGAVQFKIKANVEIPTSKVRAGYSANAIIEIENKENTLSVKESLIQFNRFTEKPFVEILNDDGVFVKKDITIGISDGISVEVLEGVKEDDKIKVWNKVLDEDEGGEGEKRPNSND
ncbi:efflux RND transporter periplasmic adaptor subunit [Flavobacteriaceae bacterium]|nr:efflux RND transporter periplasmic adaptor subunit [Flavobacteriaceae bacterium]